MSKQHSRHTKALGTNNKRKTQDAYLSFGSIGSIQGCANPSRKLCRCAGLKKYICNSRRKHPLLAAGGPFCGLHADADKWGWMCPTLHIKRHRKLFFLKRRKSCWQQKMHTLWIKPFQIVYRNCICNLYKKYVYFVKVVVVGEKNVSNINI